MTADYDFKRSRRYQIPESDFPAFSDVASRLAERFGASTLVVPRRDCQGARNQADAPMQCPCARYRNQHRGRVCHGRRNTSRLHQSSRPCRSLDISSNAASRDDGQARGVLSNCLSITGYERLCREHGLAGHPIDAILDLAEAGDASAAKVIARLAKILRDAIRTLNRLLCRAPDRLDRRLYSNATGFQAH